MEEEIKILEEMLKNKEDIIKYHMWIGTKSISAIENLINRVRELEGKPEKIKIGYDCDEDQEIIDALCIIQNKCVMDCGSIGCNNCRFGESNGDCLLAHRPRSWKINNNREFKFLK